MSIEYAPHEPTASTNETLDELRGNRAVVRRFLAEVVPSDDVLQYAAVLAPDHVQTGPAPYQEFVGIDASLNYFAGLLTAFPDLEVSVEGLLGMGDQVLAFGSLHGRHTGDLVLGDRVFPATDRDVTWKYTVGCRLADGRITETHLGVNKAGLVCQLEVEGPDAATKAPPTARRIAPPHPQ